MSLLSEWLLSVKLSHTGMHNSNTKVETTNQHSVKIIDRMAEVTQPPTVYVFTPTPIWADLNAGMDCISRYYVNRLAFMWRCAIDPKILTRKTRSC